MRDINSMCMGCMRDNPGGGVCRHCGFDNAHPDTPAHHLKPGTILNGKYCVGKSIGEGGFGITYIGWDLNLEIKVAIKEYFPNGYVSRDVANTDTITVFSGADMRSFENGRDKFIEEAKKLARFDDLPGIVSVKDFFLENGTAYIVMEFVEGETLKSFLARNGGRTAPDNIFEMMKPLMRSLAEVHSKGIIHRDISPDNIMITSNSTVKLIDFGAARDISADGSKSLSIQLKPGYAPEEQYRTHGAQGPWTDVYALSATIYRAITGIAPVESLERQQNDTLSRPSSMGVNIDRERENALMRGMAVYAKDRLQSVAELYNAVYGGITVAPPGGGGQQMPVGYGGRGRQMPVGYGGGGRQMPGSYGGGGRQIPGSYGGQVQQKSGSGVRIALISVIAFLIIALITGCVILLIVKDRREGNDSAADKEAETNVIAEEPAEEPAEEVYEPPLFDHISASSTRGTDYTSGAAVNYYPEYAFDGIYETAWSSDRSIELTPSITLSAASKQHVSGVRIANGYFKNESTYTRNRRITKVSVEYEGGSIIQSMGIDMYRIMQDIPFETPADTTYVKIQVLDTYYGDWKDIAISEIEVY